MEKVFFIHQCEIKELVDDIFLLHKRKIQRLLPNAEIIHVGSTAIPNSLTKKDIDIQVRVHKDDFLKSVAKLSTIYNLNDGSTQTDYFRAFEDDSESLPLGIQLTIMNSELDIFWEIKEFLLNNKEYIVKYNQLKTKFSGKSMQEYRIAKNHFFERLMQDPKFNS